jgi:protein TonB
MISVVEEFDLAREATSTMPPVRIKYREPSFAAILTFVLWVGCVAIGIVGLLTPYSRPEPSASKQAPVQAQILQVELTTDPLPPPDIAPLQPAAPPPLKEPILQPQAAPPMIAVAEPTAVAFAVPVEGPVQIVEPKHAAYAANSIPTNAVPAPAPIPQRITYGEGEGRQPAPEYPYQARREGQEGTVTLRFTVGDAGRVLAAEAVSPSPWTLLNEAALRVVRERWRLRPGAPRLYEVSIRFELRR